jgi:predicted nuclease of predicted toxin-antitoxin system
VRFYLDENLPTAIVDAARRLDVDVVCSRDEGRNRTSDGEQLRYATSLGRCLVTRDEGFRRRSIDAVDDGTPHAGVLIIPASWRDQSVGAIASALATYASAHPGDMPAYMVDYL